MSDFKLIFTDLDGTLLTNHKTISEANQEAIERAIKAGIDVVPCTGRSLTQIPEWLFDHKGINYAICSNGATIYNFKENRVEKRSNIPQDIALDVVKKIEPLHEFPTLYIEDEMHNKKGYIESLEGHIDQEWLEKMKDNHIIHDDYESVISEAQQGIQKFQYDFHDFDHRVQVIGKIDGLFPDLKITASGPHNIEINHPDAQKGHAVRYLMDKYKVNRDEVIVLGDNINDISMLEEVVHSVAMGNAEKRVKTAAKYTTDTADNDGVAKAINKLVFND